MIRSATHIALVGLGPDRGLHKQYPADQVWGINAANLVFDRVDLLFNMHTYPAKFEQMEADGRQEAIDNVTASLDKALADGVPVLSCAPYAHYTNIVPYPIDNIVAALGIDYFACSAAYALAYAFWTGVKRIDIYGVTGKENHEYQHPCLAYWIGRGHGHGVDIRSIGRGSNLLRTDPSPFAPVTRQTRYGFDLHALGAEAFIEKVVGQ